MISPNTIKSILDKLAQYYRYELSNADVEFWLIVFSAGVDEAELMDAVLEIVKSPTRYMPKAGEVYDIIRKSRYKAQIGTLPSVVAAVSEIRASLGEHSTQPKYSHPLIDKVVTMLGYRALGELDTKELSKTLGMAYGELRNELISGKTEFDKDTDIAIDWRNLKKIVS